MSESTPALFDVKTCSECGKRKPADAFRSHKTKCLPCVRSYKRQRYQADPAVRELARKSRERHREYNRQYSLEHYQRNREQRLAQAAEYVRANPRDVEKRRQAARLRDAKIRASEKTCSIDACGRALRNLTMRLCSPHYKRYLATGELGGEVRTRRMKANLPDATCSLAECDEPFHANDLCKRHYRAERHRLNPEEGRNSVRRRRARKLELPAGPYTLADILARDGTLCVLCGEELDLEAKFPHLRSTTVEHLECLSWPDSAGDVLSNVAAAHLTCNNARRTRPHPAAARKRAELIATQPLP